MQSKEVVDCKVSHQKLGFKSYIFALGSLFWH